MKKGLSLIFILCLSVSFTFPDENPEEMIGEWEFIPRYICIATPGDDKVFFPSLIPVSEDIERLGDILEKIIFIDTEFIRIIYTSGLEIVGVYSLKPTGIVVQAWSLPSLMSSRRASIHMLAGILSLSQSPHSHWAVNGK